MNENPLVRFLRHYGPTPASDNMYDETIQRSAEKLGIEPIEIELPQIKELVDNFRSDSPQSVILTGTAGDGKTYLCRQVWQRLGGDVNIWSKGEKINRLALASSRELVIVKDLSELNGTS